MESIEHVESIPEATHGRRTARQALIAAGAVLVLALAVWVAWTASNALLLIFAGILFSVYLSGWARRLANVTRFPYGWSLTLVLSLHAIVAALIAWFLFPAVARQAAQLVEVMPEAITRLREWIGRYDWARDVINGFTPQASGALARVAGVFSTTAGAIVSLLVILFIGIYLAAEPRLYREGLVQLVPSRRRVRARQVLDSIEETLWWWLIARLMAMAFVGGLVTSGLWLLGIPLAPTLGLLAALFDFVPNVGPILAAVPAVLIGLRESPWTALQVGVLYLSVQLTEAYIITPVLQQRAVSLAPALVIAAQVLLGVLAGGLGLLLATPLTAVAMVLVRMLYIEDWLGERP